MKAIALLLVIFTSISSFASSSASDVRFQKGTFVPAKLQKEIVRLIDENCQYITKKGWPIVESKTEKYTSPSDTMSPDLYYRTLFTVMASDNDNMHPYQFSMVVESVTKNIYSQKKATSKVLSIDSPNVCEYLSE